MGLPFLTYDLGTTPSNYKSECPSHCRRKDSGTSHVNCSGDNPHVLIYINTDGQRRCVLLELTELSASITNTTIMEK